MALKNFADVPEHSLLEMLEVVGGDGHSIYPKEFFIDKFNIPDEIISYCEHTLESDNSNPKRTIYRGGKAIDSITGVFCLDLHYRIAEDLDLQQLMLKAAKMQGRGFQAQILSKGIKEHLKCV